MEPARDERGDPGAPGRCGPPSRAAMEPARDERGDCHDLVEAYAGDTPQWSPLAMSGATSWVPCDWRNVRAAMEPARDERGDPAPQPVPVGSLCAAMEPARDERGDLPPVSQTSTTSGPQWSPLAMSGATTHHIQLDDYVLTPQWSPLAMSGAT